MLELFDATTQGIDRLTQGIGSRPETSVSHNFKEYAGGFPIG
jgi:hypothetical protein